MRRTETECAATVPHDPPRTGGALAAGLGSPPGPAATFIDLPFLPPPDIVVDLPIPPSVNRIWQRRKAGKGHVSRSREYTTWIRQADMYSIATRQLRGVKMIYGPFEVIITIQRTAGDLDNRIKGLLDWAQSRHLIENDKHCQRLTAQWGEAPRGCRMILRPMEGEV